MGNIKWTLFDAETSGLSRTNDRIISLAAITLNERFQVEDTFSTLVKSDVSPDATSFIHGITSNMLKNAPTFKEILPTLNSFLQNRVLVAHNASFDLGFLEAEATRNGGTLQHLKTLCTLQNARNLLKLPNYTLETLANHYNVTQFRAHDALDDTKVLTQIFQNLSKEASLLNKDLFCMGEKPAGKTYRTIKKSPCLYVNPGKFMTGKTLMQGMRVAFTGEHTLRENLEEESLKAGLDVTGAVSGKTSLLVSDGFASTKTSKAISVNCPVISYEKYLSLMGTVTPGNLVTK